MVLHTQQQTTTTILTRICVRCHSKHRTTKQGLQPCPACGHHLTLVFDAHTVTEVNHAKR